MKYQVRQEQYDKYRNKQRIDAEKKLKKIVEFLKQNGPLQCEKIKAQFHCGTKMAKSAMIEAGFDYVDKNYWIKQKKNGIFDPAQPSRRSKLETMTRMEQPYGINWLTRTWI